MKNHEGNPERIPVPEARYLSCLDGYLTPHCKKCGCWEDGSNGRYGCGRSCAICEPFEAFCKLAELRVHGAKEIVGRRGVGTPIAVDMTSRSENILILYPDGTRIWENIVHILYPCNPQSGKKEAV